LEFVFRSVNDGADERAGKVALTFGFAVVAYDAVVRAQVGGLAAGVGDVETDVDEVAVFGESIDFVDFQSVCFRRAQADFDFVAVETVFFLRCGKVDAFEDVVALCIQKLGLGNVGVFFAVVKQGEGFVFVAICFVFEQGHLTQVAAFFVDDGFDRVGRYGNRRCGGECGFSGSGCGGLLLLLLLRGLLCRIGFGAGEEMFPAGKDCQRDGKKCH